MAPHGLILCQDETTPHINQVEASIVFFPVLLGLAKHKKVDVEGSWISEVKNTQRNDKVKRSGVK